VELTVQNCSQGKRNRAVESKNIWVNNKIEFSPQKSA
jgi:hypothetical protein